MNILRYLCLLVFAVILSASSPVQSPVQSPVESPVFGANGVVSQGFLEDVIASTEFDIIPVDGQTQINLTVTPASGAGQTAYDLALGEDTNVSTDDPTFTAGTPDFLDHDGGDFQTQIAALTTFQKNLHKTTGGQAATIGIAFRTPSSMATGTLWSSGTQGNKGLRLIFNASNEIRLQVTDDTSLKQWTLFASLVASTDYYILVGFDFTSSTTDVEHWIETTTGVTDTDSTLSASVNDATLQWKVGAIDTGVPQILPNTTRVYAINGFNEVISDATAALAFANMETRLGLDFTP